MMESEAMPTLHVEGGAKKSYKLLFTTFVLIIAYTAVLGFVIVHLLNANKDIETTQERLNEKIKQIHLEIARLRMFVNSTVV